MKDSTLILLLGGAFVGAVILYNQTSGAHARGDKKTGSGAWYRFGSRGGTK